MYVSCINGVTRIIIIIIIIIITKQGRKEETDLRSTLLIIFPKQVTCKIIQGVTQVA